MKSGPLRGIVGRVHQAVRLADFDALTDAQLLDAFIARHDEAAFEVIVRRHGRMVFGVCQRILNDMQDAEDVFQATFLILVRKAASIRHRSILGNWLYRVAWNAALEARSVRGRRWAREQAADSMQELEWNPPRDTCDLRTLIDAELNRLPEKLRTAIILCDLEGKTRSEAAALLDIPDGTLSGRLTTAHRRLAKRLARHGLMASGGMLAAALAGNAAETPPALIANTVRSAGLFAAGSAAGIPASALALTKGVLNTMLTRKLSIVVVFIVGALAILTLGAWLGPTILARPTVQEPPKSPIAQIPALRPEPESKPPEPTPKPPEPAPRKVRTLTGNNTTVYVAFGKGGTLATYSEKKIRLWNPEGDAERHLLVGHLNMVCAAGFSPDGKTLASSDVSTVRFWDVDTGKQRDLQAGPLAGVMRLAYSPDGKKLACTFERGEIRIWDFATEKIVRTFNAEHLKDVPVITSSIAFAPDGKHLTQSYTDGHPGPSYLQLWNAETGKLERTLIEAAKLDIWSAVFSPDGKMLAAGQDGGKVTLFETNRWQKLGELDGKDMLRALAFSPDNRTLAMGMRRDTQLWDVSNGKRLRTLTGHENWVLSLAFSPDGETLASGSSDKTARLWPIERD